MFWDIPLPVTLNTGDLIVVHCCWPQAELWLAVDNGLKTGDSWVLSAWSHPKSHKTVYSWHLLLERLLSENALTIRSVPMEAQLNPLVLWVTHTEEFETFFSSFFFSPRFSHLDESTEI